MWKDLNEFSEWFIENHHPIKPPAYEPIYDTGYSLRYVVFREDRFQVEFCIVKPNSVFPIDSSKSDVNHCTLFLSGSFIGYKDDFVALDTSKLGTNPDGTSILLNRTFTDSQFDLDKLTTGDQGAAFMSIQHWAEDIAMSSLAKLTIT
jgi:hypothetical protein